MAWILVGVGGAIGAVARYAFLSFATRVAPAAVFPYGLFLVNVLGSFAIGIVVGLAVSARPAISAELRLFLAVGVLGGFTTFSSFSLDTLMLLRDGHPGLAAVNVVGQVLVSLAAVAAGYRIAA